MEALPRVHNAMWFGGPGIAEVAMALRSSLKHPFGLSILVASVTIAFLMATLPWLERWSPRASLMLGLGLTTYAAAVLAVMRTHPAISSPELRSVRAIRRAFAARREEIAASRSSARDELASVLADAIRELDERVVPALTEVVARNQRLDRHLARYESGELPQPEPRVLGRLERIQTRQREAIEECVRQASNADAALVALLQEHDDRVVARSAAAWAADLLGLHDALSEVLSDAPAPPAAEADSDIPFTADPEVAEVEEVTSPQGSDDLHWDHPFVLMVEEALRKLNHPSRLSTCALLSSAPGPESARAVSAAMLRGATPLERAQRLRDALIAAIERLRPSAQGAEPAAPRALQYYILRDEYVLDRPNSQIMARLSISESTFHRHRRGAILALARELRDQNELPAIDTSGAGASGTLLSFGRP